ncbi:hypothetical protein HPT27_14010 [Permianibacter sp. IMCC34836]|uniref:ABC transporter permease n=1 Tax=Permianibacter fluminis TaxID=2738515 RepID=UPI00155346EC|nr:hypothetical protein [Permianibacter fluminis]NQD38141.1 hypothetical protein [Permianibacter fluminis]
MFSSTVFQVARVEMILRLRRLSTLIMMVLMMIGGFWMVPDPASGYTVISSGSQRVLYDSLAIALGGSSLATILISLAGYYLISNSLSRDVRVRMGAVLAATPASSSALILGKWLGNAAYLGCVVLAMIPGGMLVQLLRGEAAINVFDFLAVYGVIFVPQVLFVSAIALWFESERWLRGRFGDVLYLFIWGGLLSATINAGESKSLSGWAGMLDVTGMGFIVVQLSTQFASSNLSVGFGDFDSSLPPIALHGLDWSLVLVRCLALVPPMLLLALAVFRFHRYNPDKVKADAVTAGVAWWAGINRRLQFLRRLLRPFWTVLPNLPAPLAHVLSDVLLTLTATPIWLLLLLIGNIVALVVPTADVANTLVFSLSAGALATAELGVRDQQTGMWQVLAAAPRLPERFLRWKLAGAVLTLLLFVGVALVRLLIADPVQALTLVVGLLFCAAATVAIGVMSRGSKLFAGGYLFLIYMTLNAHSEPGFDFAGINNVATDGSRLGYGIAAAGLVLLVWLVRRWQQR